MFLICILLVFGEHGISSLLLHDFLLLIWLEPIKNTAEWFWACTGTWANELDVTDGCCTREYPFWLGSTPSLGELKFFLNWERLFICRVLWIKKTL